MARRRSPLLWIGVVLSIIGCVLIAKPFEREPLWVQWMLGFPMFYVGVPLAIMGAAIYFVGYNSGPKNPFVPRTTNPVSNAPRPRS